MPARVFPEYLNKGKNKKRFNDLYAMALYSDDRGKSWSSSAPFPIGGTGESGLVELSNGKIYHNSRTHMRPGNRRIAYSHDAGETWVGEHEDDELFDGPPDVYGCKAGLLRLPYEDRDILLFSSPGNRQTRTDITVWVSFDGGQSWPVHRLIKEGPGNYTWIAAGRKGTPSEGFVYLLAGKDWMARFNLSWLLESNHPGK
jgi:sialidase-1